VVATSEGRAPSAALGAFELAGTAVALIDADGTVAGWTQGAQRLTGYCAAEVVGRPAAVLLACDGDPAKGPAAGEACRAQGGWSGLAKFRHRDGRRLTVRLRVTPLTGQGGRAAWLVFAAGGAAHSTRPADGSVAALPPEVDLLTHPVVGAFVRDTRLRCRWVNDTLEFLDGIPAERRLGRRLADVVPRQQAGAVEAMMRQVLETGVPAMQEQIWPPGPGSREEAFVASYARLEGAGGRALGVCGIRADLIVDWRARERLALLAEASTRIGTSLDVTSTGQELADLAVPLLADVVSVDVAESVLTGQPPARAGPAGGGIAVLRSAGLASVDRDAIDAFTPGQPVPVPPTSPFAQVLRSGRPYLEAVVTPSRGRRPGQDAGLAQKIREYRAHSVMAVPIRARGAVLGVATFARTQDPAPFEHDDLLLAGELAARAAVSLDNARQYARERAAALALQRDLLPRRVTGGSALAEVAWSYQPCDRDGGVGGDWFDVICLPGARVGLVIGDVAGHGINAAAAMGRLRATVQTLAHLDLPPGELLARLDDTILRLADECDGEGPAATEVGATCLYAVYDPITRRCEIARAGHPPPAIAHPDGTVTFPDLPAGAPLGVGLVPFEPVELELPAGSVLAFYTDGLIDGRGRDIDTGMAKLATVLASPGLPLPALSTAAIRTMAAQEPTDDVTLLLARTRSLGPGEVASWQLEADPAVVSRARSLTRRQLSRWGLGHQAPDTELIVSELLTNAIRHATGPLRLRLIRHQTLTCEVFDTSSSTPRPCRPRATDEDGHGLLLVTSLTRNWGTRHTPDGKIVWAEQDLRPAP
jgi:PAS domain S-box-containing protein